MQTQPEIIITEGANYLHSVILSPKVNSTSALAPPQASMEKACQATQGPYDDPFHESLLVKTALYAPLPKTVSTFPSR